MNPISSLRGGFFSPLHKFPSSSHFPKRLAGSRFLPALYSFTLNPPFRSHDVPPLQIPYPILQGKIKQQRQCIVEAVAVTSVIYIAYRIFQPKPAPFQPQPPTEQDQLKVWNHVQELNATNPKNINHKEALKELQVLKYWGGLGQCYNPSSAIQFVGESLVEWLFCRDHRMRTEALYHLTALLNQKVETGRDSEEFLLKLEVRLRQVLCSLAEESPWILEEIMYAYRLVIEHIYIHNQTYGLSSRAFEVLNQIDEITKRIGGKLVNSPHFQYQLAYTKYLVKQIKNKSLQVFYNSTITSGDLSILGDNFEQVLPLKNIWDIVPASEKICQLKKIADKQRNAQGWGVLYAVVEAFHEIALSSPDEELKKEALTQLIDLIQTETPWQIRYKIKESLLLLKSNPALYRQWIKAREKDERYASEQANHWYTERLAMLKDKQKALEDNQRDLRPDPIGKWPKQQQHLIERLEDLDKVASNFRTKHTTATVFQVISGLQGQGKTELAIQYYHRYGRDYAGVCFLDASQQLEVEAGLLTLANKLGIHDQYADKAREKLKEFLEQREPQEPLEQRESQKPGYLFIVDGLDITGEGGAAKFDHLQRSLPNEGAHHVLITAVGGYWLGHTNLVHPLDSFTLDQAISHILRYCRKIEGADDTIPSQKEIMAAEDLAVKLGKLPLVLQLVAAFFKDSMALSLQEYFNLFSNQKKRQAWLSDNKDTKDLMAIWSLNMEKATKIKDHAALFCLCCHLEPKVIPRLLLQQWLHFHLTQSFENSEEVTLPLNKALIAFRNYSLISESRVLNSNSQEITDLSMHPLLQEVARNYFTHNPLSEPLKAEAILFEAISILERSFSSEDQEADLNKASFYLHALSVLRHTENVQDKIAQRTRLYLNVIKFIQKLSCESALNIAENVKNVDTESGDWTALIIRLKLAVEQAKRVTSPTLFSHDQQMKTTIPPPPGSP